MTHKKSNFKRVYFGNGNYLDLPRKQVREIDKTNKKREVKK